MRGNRSMKELVKGTEVVSMFGKDVSEGLSSSPKKLQPKYLYDDKGSKLFEEIMNLEEYYPTRCEYEILENYKSQLVEFFTPGESLDVVDLGAGNGYKAMVLINFFLRRLKFRFIPVDISKAAVSQLQVTLTRKYPALKVAGMAMEYFEALRTLKKESKARKLVLFLGSNIGNFSFREALGFLKDLKASLNQDDLILIGFDLKKDPDIIRKAYNDSRGVTAHFNLNILQRINTELGGQFDPETFSFYPDYNPLTGEVKSYLISKEEQNVYIRGLDKSFYFEKWEPIHTECSNKFDLPLIQKLALHSGFEIEADFYDSRQYFVDSLWKVK